MPSEVIYRGGACHEHIPDFYIGQRAKVIERCSTGVWRLRFSDGFAPPVMIAVCVPTEKVQP